MNEPIKIKLSNPGDLVTAVPYLIGFHPTDSVVTTAFYAVGGARKRLGPTFRADMPGNDPVSHLMFGSVLTDYLRRAAADGGPAGVPLTWASLAFVTVGDDLPGDELLSELRAVAESVGATCEVIVHTNGTTPGSVWSCRCGEGCTMPGGIVPGQHMIGDTYAANGLPAPSASRTAWDDAGQPGQYVNRNER